MNLKPLLNRVVVGNIKSASLKVNDLDYNEAVCGKVLAVGPGMYIDRLFTTPIVKVDDLVIFDSLAGLDFEFDKQKVKVIEDTEILLVVDDG